MVLEEIEEVVREMAIDPHLPKSLKMENARKRVGRVERVKWFLGAFRFTSLLASRFLAPIGLGKSAQLPRK